MNKLALPKNITPPAYRLLDAAKILEIRVKNSENQETIKVVLKVPLIYNPMHFIKVAESIGFKFLELKIIEDDDIKGIRARNDIYLLKKYDEHQNSI
jgi:hypothetical protein